MIVEELVVLGTGNGGALKCYNTCFALKKDNEYFVVDGGGGSQILHNLKALDIDLSSIHNIFLSHNHLDHIIGVLWLIRVIGVNIARNKDYVGNLNIYASDETMEALTILVDMLAPSIVKNIWGTKIVKYVVKHMDELEILGCKTMFINIHASKEKQFGFKMEIADNKYLTFLGDEPFNKSLEKIIKNSDWILHEAFCLDREEKMFHAYEKGHCTVKDASENAEFIEAKNLILWHTKDNDLKNRNELYTNEAKQYFNGNIFVPNDLDKIELCKKRIK